MANFYLIKPRGKNVASVSTDYCDFVIVAIVISGCEKSSCKDTNPERRKEQINSQLVRPMLCLS
jgi:hypothetical protein